MLVTGSAGFIGSHFVWLMHKRYPNLSIISLDKLTYAGNLNNLASLENEKNHTIIQGDILDSTLIATLLRKFNIDTIVHFAAESHVDNSIAAPQAFVETNVLGTFHLLEQARLFWQHEKNWNKTHCRFHHISTDEVYGSLNVGDQPFTEKTPYAPNSPYSASKASADHLVRAYFQTYQLPITISSCSNNYGPNQHTEKFIPVVVNSCIHQKPILIYGDGKNIRDWLYVDDHCDAIDLILKKGVMGESYNIGGQNEIDNMALVNTICDIMDVEMPEHAPHKNLIQYVADRKGHDRRYAVDNKKIIALGWKKQHAFKDTLKSTISHLMRRLAYEQIF